MAIELEEEWRDVVGYKGSYQVSNQGRVKSLPRKHSEREFLLKHKVNKQGYYLYSLTKNRKTVSRQAHRLVARSFLEKINPSVENKLHVNHIDGDKSNNHLSNLEWTTPSENIKHAISLGLIKKIPRDSYAKTNKEDVKLIRDIYALETALGRHIANRVFTHKKLGEIFGLERRSVGDIVNRRIWKDVE